MDGDYDDVVTSIGLYKNGIALQPVIADLIRNPEGRQGHTGEQDRPTNSPSPLIGRGIKGEGEQDNTNHLPSFPRRRAVHRDENDEERSSSALKAHTLAQRDRRLVNPQGGRVARVKQDNTTYRIPSPLMGEESKSLSQCLTLGSEGENDAQHRPNPENPLEAVILP